jgi:hypothetical protein
MTLPEGTETRAQLAGLATLLLPAALAGSR